MEEKKSTAIFRRLCDALFPKDFPCVACAGEEPVNALGLCRRCTETVLANDRPCPVCARPLPKKGLCPYCSKGMSALDGGAAPFLYSGAICKVIAAFKFRSHAYLAERMARPMCAVMPAGEFDFIVAVPGSRRNNRNRGYNPAGLLAKEISRIQGIPLLENALLRSAKGASQRTLSYAARRENAEKVFSVRPISELNESRVLLVDDVTTTGATADFCAHRLKEAGARAVYLLAFAATDLH